MTDVAYKHAGLLAGVADEKLRHARLCELNAIEQALNVCQTTVVRDAWSRGQPLAVHGWVYALGDGRVRELKMDVAAADQIDATYQAALAEVADVVARGRRDD